MNNKYLKTVAIILAVIVNIVLIIAVIISVSNAIKSISEKQKNGQFTTNEKVNEYSLNEEFETDELQESVYDESIEGIVKTSLMNLYQETSNTVKIIAIMILISVIVINMHLFKKIKKST